VADIVLVAGDCFDTLPMAHERVRKARAVVVLDAAIPQCFMADFAQNLPVDIPHPKVDAFESLEQKTFVVPNQRHATSCSAQACENTTRRRSPIALSPDVGPVTNYSL
jgi:hypothetical protein